MALSTLYLSIFVYTYYTYSASIYLYRVSPRLASHPPHMIPAHTVGGYTPRHNTLPPMPVCRHRPFLLLLLYLLYTCVTHYCTVLYFTYPACSLPLLYSATQNHDALCSSCVWPLARKAVIRPANALPQATLAIPELAGNPIPICFCQGAQLSRSRVGTAPFRLSLAYPPPDFRLPHHQTTVRTYALYALSTSGFSFFPLPTLFFYCPAYVYLLRFLRCLFTCSI